MIRDRRVAAVALVGALLVVAGGCFWRDRRIVIDGDGIGYFAPLASVLVDGDLNLADEIATQVSPALQQAIYLGPDGTLGNPFSIGPALLWAPAAVIVKALPPDPRLDTPPVMPWRTTDPGYRPRFARAVFTTNAIVLLVSAAILAWVLQAFVPWWIAGFSVAAAAGGTSTLAYVLFDPSHSHAASFAAVAWLVAAVARDRRKRLPLPVLGACLGLVTMMRWQDVVLGALLIPRIAEELQDAPRAKWFRVAAQLGVPVVLLMVPQMFFWNRIYGTPLLVPPGPDFAPWWRPAALPMLFSTWNGAFVWSPLLLVGLLGLRHLDDRRLRWGALAGILLHIYVCALLLDWWGGRSFGCRRMISLAPLAAWGLALLLAKLAVRRTALAAAMFGVALACAWNLQLAVCQRYGVMPWNVGNSADYVRHHDPSSASARPYRKFDYPRLVREFRAAQPWLDSARSAR